MDVRPVASVIIPTRNRSGTLRRCLEALSQQTFRRFEVIIVDDGSTDDTPAVLAGFSADDSRLVLRALRNNPQIGANPSRNRGIRESRGELIAFLDDDCIAEPAWLEHLVSGFVNDKVGAVTGTVLDPEPANMFELMFKGTHYVFSPDGIRATRLVGGNMCVRSDLIRQFMFDEDRASVSADTSVSGRGDESSLFPRLRALGYEQRIVRNAVVLHDHRYSGRQLFHQAYKSGGAHARLAYKYRRRPPLELLPLLATYVFLPAGILHSALWSLPVMCALVFLAGIYHSERSRKNKTPGETMRAYPIVLIYYHLRLVGYVMQQIRLRLGIDRIQRVSASRQ